MKATRLSIFCVAVSLVLCIFAAAQQDTSTHQADRPQENRQETRRDHRPADDRQGAQGQGQALRKELATPYRKWLNEDVAYIITDEERSAFMRLQTDEEREQLHRELLAAPRSHARTPSKTNSRKSTTAASRTPTSTYASGIPGWKTDRGRIYITYGPPDEIDDHSSGGSYERPPEEGGGETSTYPLPAVALPLHRRRRHQRHHRIRGSHHVGRVPHDHGPLRKGRPAVRSQRRSDHPGTDGHVATRPSASTTPTAPTWPRRWAVCPRA